VNKKVDGQRKQQERKKKGWDVRVQMGRTMGKKGKEKGTSYRRNNNRGKIGDSRKATRKGRRRRMHGKKS
jgi:hypothetical protein